MKVFLLYESPNRAVLPHSSEWLVRFIGQNSLRTTIAFHNALLKTGVKVMAQNQRCESIRTPAAVAGRILNPPTPAQK